MLSAVGWIVGEHPTAQRLIQHADRQYDTTLLVRRSRRPWAEFPEQLSNASGNLWHADFLPRAGSINPSGLWADTSGGLRSLLVHLRVDPYQVGFTFSAVDDADVVADAIGQAFDVFLLNLRSGQSRHDDHAGFQRRARGLDYRVQSGTGWTIVDESTVPISIFGAGGGVDTAQQW